MKHVNSHLGGDLFVLLRWGRVIVPQVETHRSGEMDEIQLMTAEVTMTEWVYSASSTSVTSKVVTVIAVLSPIPAAVSDLAPATFMSRSVVSPTSPTTCRLRMIFTSWKLTPSDWL